MWKLNLNSKMLPARKPLATAIVRGNADWNAGHIPDGVHLELHNVFSEARLSEVVGKDEEVVIYCAGFM